VIVWLVIDMSEAGAQLECEGSLAGLSEFFSSSRLLLDPSTSAARQFGSMDAAWALSSSVACLRRHSLEPTVSRLAATTGLVFTCAHFQPCSSPCR